MSIGDALWQIFQVFLALGLVAVFILLLAYATRLVLTIILSLLGIGLILALFWDAANGSPVLRRFGWVIVQIFWILYNGIYQATNGMPQI